MKKETTRLNPFVYIPETDIRFYLLVIVGIIMPSFSFLSFSIITLDTTIMIFSTEYSFYNLSFLSRLLITVPIFSLIPILIYWNYKRFPKKIIEESKSEEFHKKRFPDHCGYVGELYGKYLSTMKQPTLMYQPEDPLNPLVSAFTFGTKNQTYIELSAGLIKKYRTNRDSFKSIFLHEMGHIADKDVEKAYLAASTWRSLLLTLSVPVGIFLLNILIDVSISASARAYLIEVGTILMSIIGGYVLYFLLFLAIVYVLRKQIIRVREFYADAKVLDWEESPKDMIETLEEFSGEQHSKFELLTKFHPNINERIQALRDNSRLFIPSLWIAFAIGFSYGLIEHEILPTIIMIFSVTVTDFQDTVFRTFISFFIFPVVMLAVSSSFHKSILRDIFVDYKRYFSTTTILNSIKFSTAFSFGWITQSAISFIPNLYRYTIIESMIVYLEAAISWIFHAIYFLIIMIFLLIFASMLIRRSFSRKSADRNFLMVTILSSALYIINRYVAIEIFRDMFLMIIFSLSFLVVTYVSIKIKDRELYCPNCNKRISSLSGVKLNCPNCHHNLYSWAIYSF